MGFRDFFMSLCDESIDNEYLNYKNDVMRQRQEREASENAARAYKKPSYDNPQRTVKPDVIGDGERVTPASQAAKGIQEPRDYSGYKRGGYPSAYDDDKWSRPFSAPKPAIKKKNVIMIVLENTLVVREHKKEILALIKKIVSDNAESFFVFLRTGSDKKYFELMDFDKLEKEKVIDELFPDSFDVSEKVQLSDVLKHIHSTLEEQYSKFSILRYENKTYDIEANSIIFIGTAAYENTEEAKKEILKEMKFITSEKKRIKTIKYFCIIDKNTINAAMLGFPVIGHLITDFYR